jgi:hypothetical protein
MDCRQSTKSRMQREALWVLAPFKKGGSVMLTVEEVKDAIKASPFYEKWGNEKDIEEIINRIKTHIDPFSLYNHNVFNEVGEVYAGEF